MQDPSFEEYVHRAGPGLIRYAYLLSGDWSLAEDLVQEALVSAHQKWRRVRKMDHPDAYVRKAVTRRFLTWKRRRSSGEAPFGLLVDRAGPASTDHARATVERDESWRMLAALPGRQRAVLVLRYYEDLPDDRIADLLGCSPSTVRVHAARGLATLRAAGLVVPARETAP